MISLAINPKGSIMEPFGMSMRQPAMTVIFQKVPLWNLLFPRMHVCIYNYVYLNDTSMLTVIFQKVPLWNLLEGILRKVP
jgi:hypothetical protein